MNTRFVQTAIRTKRGLLLRQKVKTEGIDIGKKM